jgi:hypothetical protein
MLPIDTRTLFKKLSFCIILIRVIIINDHSLPSLIRTPKETQLEQVTRRLAVAFQEVHQLCLD